MAPPDGIGGAARPNLYVSYANKGGAPDNRADVLAKRLDEKLSKRLDQIRTQMSQPQGSPNTEQTGKRLDVLA